MKATPRSDEEAGYYGLGGSVSVEFARQLERELAVMQARAEKSELECVEWQRLHDMQSDIAEMKEASK